MNPQNTLELAKLAAKIADDKLGRDILILDLRAETSIADYFVLVSATSHLHVRSLEDSIRDKIRHAGGHLLRTDGQRGHLWRVLDYGSILIHIMDEKTREFYSVERLWSHGKVVPFAAAKEEKPQAAAKPKAKKKAAPKSKPKKKAPAKKAKPKKKSSKK